MKVNSILAGLLLALVIAAAMWLGSGEEQPNSLAPPELGAREPLRTPELVAEPPIAEEKLRIAQEPQVSNAGERLKAASPGANSRFPPYYLNGTVVDDAGNPVQTSFRVATVNLNSGIKHKSKAFENDEGHFSIILPSAGRWSLEVKASGYSKPNELPTIMLPRASEEMIKLSLIRDSSAQGQVVDGSGNPLAGARVNCYPAPHSLNSTVRARGTRTDETGHFVLKGLGAGAAEFQAEHDAWATSGPVRVELRAAETVSDLVIVMRNGGALTGVAVERDGRPARLHKVELDPLESGRPRIKITTDSAGRFEAPHLTPGTYELRMKYDVQTQSEDWLDLRVMLDSMATTVVTIVEGESVHAVLGGLPIAPVLVRGRITQGGQPAPNQPVIVAAGSLQTDKLKFTETNEHGAYEVTLDAPGEHLFLIHKGGGGGNSEFFVTIPEVKEHTFDFSLPSASIQGRVLDPGGKPSRAAVVVLMRDDGLFSLGDQLNGTLTPTNENGEFILKGLTAGEYLLRTGGPLRNGSGARFASVVRSGIHVDADEALVGITLRLNRPGTLSGTIKNSKGGRVPMAKLYVRDQHGRLLANDWTVETNRASEFELAGFPPGELEVTAVTQDGATPTPVQVRILEGQNSAVQLVIQSGTLLEITGEGTRNFAMSIVDRDGREYSLCISPRSRELLFEKGFSPNQRHVGPLAPGEYTVTLTSEDGRRATSKVRLNGEPNHALKLRLE